MVRLFFGSVRIVIKASSSSCSRVVMTGSLPTNSGIKPNFIKSSGLTCPISLSVSFSDLIDVTLAPNPIPVSSHLCWITDSRPENAFSGLESVIQQRCEETGIGFGANVTSIKSENETDKLIGQVRPEDLIKFGLIPEFVGRLPVITTLEQLDEDALITILTEPKNSLTKQFSKLFEMEDVELDIRDDALSEIAKKAIERKTGARGLRSILESILMETMYKVPSEESLNKVVLDASVVKGESEPLMVYEKTTKTKTG